MEIKWTLYKDIQVKDSRGEDTAVPPCCLMSARYVYRLAAAARTIEYILWKDSLDYNHYMER